MKPTKTGELCWTPAYELGVPTIDKQHAQLVEMLRELQRAMSEGRAQDVLDSILDRLVSYTRVHFATEERLMIDSHYPLYHQHKQEHEELTESVGRFLQEYRRKRAVLSIQLLPFLREWLLHHIMESDRKLGQHLRAAKSRPAQGVLR